MAAAAASRLQSALASYRKVSSGGDVTEAVASLERVIVAAKTRGIGSCALGLQPQAATVAAALAFNAGCGAGITAMARAFKLENNIAGVRRLADRLATRAYLWEAGAEASAAGCSTTPPPVSSPQSSANGGAAIDSSLPSPARSSPLSPPPAACPQCAQPPLSPLCDFWNEHSGTDLATCPTCDSCRLPIIPTCWQQLVQQINEKHGHQPLAGGEFDNGTVGVPRPHENALWHAPDEAVQLMATLLREKQSKCTPWEQIVRLSSDADWLVSRPRQRPLQVVCTCCATSFNFDFIFGAIKRIEHNESSGRGTKYLSSPSITDFNERVVPLVLKTLDSPEMEVPPLEWRCCNCETTEMFAAARRRNRAAELAAAAALGLQGRPPQPRFDLATAATTVQKYSVGLGAALRVRACDIPTLPCATTRARSLDGFEPVAGALLLRRELAEQLVNGDAAQLAALMGAPSVHNLFSVEAAAIGGDDATRALAGGDGTVNMALLLLAPGSLIDQVMLLPLANRADALLKAMREPSSHCEAVAVASLDGELPSAEAVLNESAAFFQARRGANGTENGKCETGRPGRVQGWSSLMSNPDINRYARMASQAGGKTHTDHMLIVANPSLDAMHALFIYPSGPNGRAAPYLPPAAQLKDGKRKAASKSAVAAAKKRRSELVRNSVLLVGSLHPYASTSLRPLKRRSTCSTSSGCAMANLDTSRLWQAGPFSTPRSQKTATSNCKTGQTLSTHAPWHSVVSRRCSFSPRAAWHQDRPKM